MILLPVNGVDGYRHTCSGVKLESKSTDLLQGKPDMSKTLLFTRLFLLAASGTSVAVAEDLSGYSGAQLFQRFCASCHGKSGEGNGPVAPFFKLQPPDLTQLARRSGGQFPAEKIRKIIDGRERLLPHGTREMPVWGLELELADGQAADPRKQADANILLLVEHLRSIQVK
jgi:mono/diheme cytochrome c family protein